LFSSTHKWFITNKSFPFSRAQDLKSHLDSLREKKKKKMQKNLDAALADAALARKNMEENFKFR
jgi:outer membrane murein-binding lipoprotein Lpp